MVKYHYKRITVSKNIQLPRKLNTWITRPNPGSTSIELGVSLNYFLKEMVDLARTTREVKYILQNHEILVDQKPVKELKYLIGLMSTISIPLKKKNYRLILNEKGKLAVIEISDKEAKTKICKVLNKKTLKGKKTQLNLSSGRNILSDENIKIGNSVIISLPEQKIESQLPLEKNHLVLLTGGKHIGKTGIIKEINNNSIIIDDDKKSFETSKSYVLVIGKNRSLI